jgi:hypothetical protein
MTPIEHMTATPISAARVLSIQFVITIRVPYCMGSMVYSSRLVVRSFSAGPEARLRLPSSAAGLPRPRWPHRP